MRGVESSQALLVVGDVGDEIEVALCAMATIRMAG
jgi:hypothetical protein